MGPSAAQHARSEIEGIAGSCKWSKSKLPAPIHCRTLAYAIGPKRTRATAPLYGIEIGFGANQNYLHQSTVALWRMQSDQREHGQLRRYME